MTNNLKLIVLTLMSLLGLSHCFLHPLQKREADPLLDIPGKIRPFCTKIVGTIESAPQVCNKISDFIVDAAVSSCQESFAEILRICTGSACLQSVAKQICPQRGTMAKKIKPHIMPHCQKKLQKFVDASGRSVGNVGTERICNEFIEAVRETCHYSIARYCGDFRFPYEFPCSTYLPRIICD